MFENINKMVMEVRGTVACVESGIKRLKDEPICEFEAEKFNIEVPEIPEVPNMSEFKREMAERTERGARNMAKLVSSIAILNS